MWVCVYITIQYMCVRVCTIHNYMRTHVHVYSHITLCAHTYTSTIHNSMRTHVYVYRHTRIAILAAIVTRTAAATVGAHLPPPVTVAGKILKSQRCWDVTLYSQSKEIYKCPKRPVHVKRDQNMWHKSHTWEGLSMCFLKNQVSFDMYRSLLAGKMSHTSAHCDDTLEKFWHVVFLKIRSLVTCIGLFWQVKCLKHQLIVMTHLRSSDTLFSQKSGLFWHE